MKIIIIMTIINKYINNLKNHREVMKYRVTIKKWKLKKWKIINIILLKK